MYHGIKLLVIFSFICISVNAEPPEYDDEVCIGQDDGTLLGITGYCTYYYYCQAEIGYIEDCKSYGDFQFDESIKDCNYLAEVNCVEEPEYLDYPDLNVILDDVCPTNRPGEILLFESLKCTEYYICANGVKLTMKCIKGLVFNTKNNQCDNPIYNPRCSNLSLEENSMECLKATSWYMNQCIAMLNMSGQGSNSRVKPIPNPRWRKK